MVDRLIESADESGEFKNILFDKNNGKAENDQARYVTYCPYCGIKLIQQWKIHYYFVFLT